MRGSIRDIDVEQRLITIELDAGETITLAFEEEPMRLEREVKRLGDAGAREFATRFDAYKATRLKAFAAGENADFDPEKIRVRDCIRSVYGF